MYKILGGDGKEYGPIPADTLRQWVNEGRANSQTQVQSGGGAWIALGQVPEFSLLFASNPAPGGAPGIISPGSTAPTMNVVGLIGFILSLSSLPLLCCCYGLPLNLAGIVCSVIGLVQIRKAPERYRGQGLAMAGLIVGIASVLLGIVVLIAGVAMTMGDFQKNFRNM